jgi:hypothetical protein
MKTFLIVLLTFFAFALQAQTTLNHTVYFDVDSYTISSSEKDKVLSFFNSLNKQTIKKVTVKGHTDFDASDSYNKTLSENRNTAVINHLPLSKKTKSNVQALSFGESMPTESNKTKEGKQQNRCVEIIVELEPVFAPKTSSYYFDNWDKTAQSFTINNSKSHTLKGKEGTIIYLPPNAFCLTKSGGKVTISLKEYYKLSDILMAQLSTSSNDNMLETKGMVEITATVDGEQVPLCKEAVIMFPSKEDDKGFRGFNGVHDTTHNIMDWQTSSKDGFKNIDASLIGEGGVFRGRSFPSDCINTNVSIKIRCNANCTSKVLQGQGRPYYRRVFRSDEVIRKLRRQYWFRSSVSMGKYDATYWRIKDKMKDTLSASAYWPCYNQQKKEEELENYLEDLANGGEFDGTMLNQSLNYIVTKTSNLGFINCDRFSDIKKKSNYTFNIGEHTGAISSKLIFHRIKSIMPGYAANRKVNFNNIPVGETVTLLVVKYFRDKVYVASPKFKLGQNPDLRFKIIDKSKLEETLKQITKGI